MKVFDYKILRKLLNQVNPYRYTFIVTVLISILFSCLSISRPLLIQYAFDNYILSYNSDGLLKIMIGIFILLFLEAFFQFLFVYKSNYLAQIIIKNIRDQVFSKILSFKIAYFDTTPTGQLITRVISDLEAISSVFSQGLVVIFGDFFKMFLILLAMFIVNWKLALVSLVFLPFLIFATFLFQKYMKQAFIEVRKQIARINIFVYEHIIGMSIVQIFGREKKELESFKMINAEHRNAHIKTVLYFSVFLPIVDVCSAIAMGILVWYGAINAIEGDVTIGEIIAFILFINMLFRPLRGIADRFNILQMGIVASTRVFKILENNTNTDLDLSKSNASLSDLDGDIIFKNVNFSYTQGEPVLKGINLKIDKNKTLAIIGSTGSGKTTIINLLMKWYDLLDGDILINNQSVSNIANSQLRRSIGIVLQDNFFLADTLINNIKFFNKISDDVVFKAVREIGLESFINKFPNRYNYYIGERGSGLSEGEKQLVMFLRTYLLNPSILILDEATSSMDPVTENLIQRAIQKITTERTSIIIAHRLSTIKYAHKIVLLENGNIIESGSHEDLMKLNGKYANYYYQQFMYH